MKVRRYLQCICLIAQLLTISACTSEPSLQLIDVHVDITTDENIAGGIGVKNGDKEVGKLVPTIIHYKFKIKNTARQRLGNVSGDSIKIRVQPSDELLSLVGNDVFDKNRIGYQGRADLAAGEEGEFTLTYSLGVTDTTGLHHGTEQPPSSEKLKKIEKKLLKAILVVKLGDKEINRFDLQKLTEQPTK
jgi:hypothetical protein